ncbi:hypothetical protein [Acholeplasma hippikon]|uniref:Uncharacterized protein n=1 Tax=Acholeplasma hippikon TaxID=264636 RepID=A0A449BHT7_9MOLU|nr:hypothetical protein [Acholeplasma hippikon]VEU82000.1 Uncharacterised protein [Acholeplasma hippikon]
MKKNKILNKIYKHELSIDEGYEQLYKKELKKYRAQNSYIEPKKASFVKLKFKLQDHKHVTNLINFLFLIPVPVGIMRLFKNQIDDYEEVRKMLVKGISIEVQSEDTNIKIKTY